MKKILVLITLMFGWMAFAQAIPFTLRNNTLASIPLEIPGVMNPNLSPMSNSSVDLAVGQKIFFWGPKMNGRGKQKYLLLEVTEALQGKTLDVGSLIRERKKELSLKL